jgi:hypothetical protein
MTLPSAEKLFGNKKDQLSNFTMLDYGFSVPVEYKIGIVLLSLVPSYAIAEINCHQVLQPAW